MLSSLSDFELEAVLLRNIRAISSTSMESQAQAVAEQRSVGLDFFRAHVDAEGRDDQFGDFWQQGFDGCLPTWRDSGETGGYGATARKASTALLPPRRRSWTTRHAVLGGGRW